MSHTRLPFVPGIHRASPPDAALAASGYGFWGKAIAVLLKVPFNHELRKHRE
jgi:hypothetical protein